MSSGVYLRPEQPITLQAWLDFCKTEGIVHYPTTVGGTYFYHGGKHSVEIKFGEWVNVSDKVPPPVAEKVAISTYFMGKARPEVVRIAKAVLRTFPGEYEADEELQTLMAQKDEGEKAGLVDDDEGRKRNIEAVKRELCRSAAATLKAALKAKRLGGCASGVEDSQGSYEDEVDNIARHLGL